MREKIDSNLDSFFPSSPDSKVRTKREAEQLVSEVNQNPERSLAEIQKIKGLPQDSQNPDNLKAHIFQANLIDLQEGLNEHQQSPVGCYTHLVMDQGKSQSIEKAKELIMLTNNTIS